MIELSKEILNEIAESIDMDLDKAHEIEFVMNGYVAINE